MPFFVWASINHLETVRPLLFDDISLGPQYIQKRSATFLERDASSKKFQKFEGRSKELIEHADVFFLASVAPGSEANAGADASHRGGKPGFVLVESETTLVVPEFVGNDHFNTLGNWILNDKASLLFLDFQNGDTLSLKGRVDVKLTINDDDLIRYFAGAERYWRFTLDEGTLL